jgi:hypothetical protein
MEKSFIALVSIGGFAFVLLKCFGELAIPAVAMMLALAIIPLTQFIFGIIEWRDRN